MSESTVDRDPFERLAEEFAERLRRGEHPSLTEYIARCPDHADDIRELFPALALVEQYKSADNSELSSPASVPAARDLPDRLGDYRILRYLGEGGMGIVYEAVRESLHSHVALKVMHVQYRNREKYLRRFRTEARAAARLHHTNIVSVFDYGVEDGVCFYAMQYIAGQSLDKILVDLRQLRKEKTGFAAAEAATLGSGPDGRLVPGEGAIRAGTGGAPTDPLRQTVAFGILTGRYATAVPAEASDNGNTPPLPVGSVATRRGFADAGQMELWAHQFDGQMGTIVGHEIEHTGTTSRALGFEPGQAEREISPAREPSPDSGDAPDSAQPSADGSTSTLIDKRDARYYREVARLGAQVADALAYAHHRGVLHRDIKPPNLILDPLGNIWIADFGLAKFEEGDDLSLSHDIAGTLRYMAPERLRGISTARCDIYALGTTLYELLTLRPPFEGKDQLQLIHRIEHDPPVLPRQIERHIPLDLETIVLRALAKEPNDRFATAEEMASELRLFVENRPIRSRPIPLYQQFWRWCRRNPGLAGANIAAAVLTTILAIVSTFAAWTFRDQRNAIGNNLIKIQESEAEARGARTEAREELFKALLDRARAGRFSHRMGQRFDTLAALRQAAEIGHELKLPLEKFDLLRDQAIACLALPDLKPTGRVITRPPGVILAVFDPTMTRYALRFRDGAISVRRVADDQEVAHFQARGDRDIGVFGFSPNGRYLAGRHRPDGALTVWDIDHPSVSLNDPGIVSGSSARFSPDSRRLALVHDDGEILVYDLATGHPSRRWRGPGPAQDMTFRGDGVQIAVTYNEKQPTCRIIDAETFRIIQSIPLPTNGSVAWSPDGATLATSCADTKIYLWDAATGARKATLEGHTAGGVVAAFHPAGTLLASSDWSGQLRLWDSVLGRPLLNLTGGGYEFSQDGRIVISLEDQLTPYQVDPALEYRTLAHASREKNFYGRPSVRHDGRVLAVGTSQGVVLWDLARGTELAFLPIGEARHLMFEASGDLITSGSIGVQRWPIQLDTGHAEFHIGPPLRLPLPASFGGIAEDRSGRIVALADHDFAFVATPERTVHVGPLDDCRGVAVSPDGQWLATGTHYESRGAQVWRIPDFTKVAELPIDGGTGVAFSPDGKWLVAGSPRLRLWEVGTWREERQITDVSGFFSSDGRLMVVQDASKMIRLVETETGRTLARLESPDLCGVSSITFSRNGSRLVVTTHDGPAVHVWDLRAIRKHLAGMGLDWDAPAYSDDDPASLSAPPLPPLQVNLGPSPLTWYPEPKVYDGVIADLEAMLTRQPDQRRIRGLLAYYCNEYAWGLATGPASTRDSRRALALARRTVELAPKAGIYLNTFGIAQYRAGQYAEAVATLEKSLGANGGQFAAFDLFFLAMAHHGLGHHDQARDCYDRAVVWMGQQHTLEAQSTRDLAAFRAEAEAVLAGDLPDDVFAESRS